MYVCGCSFVAWFIGCYACMLYNVFVICTFFFEQVLLLLHIICAYYVIAGEVIATLKSQLRCPYEQLKQCLHWELLTFPPKHNLWHIFAQGESQRMGTLAL
jgi:hypothetical protein